MIGKYLVWFWFYNTQLKTTLRTCYCEPCSVPEALVLQWIYNAQTKTTFDFQLMSVPPIICVFEEQKAGEMNKVSFFTFGFLSFSAM